MLQSFSVNMFRNSSVFHDLSTSVDYSTILYKFASMGGGKKFNEAEKKANSWTKTAAVINRENIKSNNKKS